MKYRVPILILFLSASQLLAAQQEGGQVLTLKTIITLALGHSPIIGVSRARVDAAEARASEVHTQLLPSLKLTARAAALSEVPEMALTLPPPIGRMTLFPSITENVSARISLQQPLFAGFRLVRAEEMTSLQSVAAKEDMKKDLADVVLDVTVAYWSHVRARQIERAVVSSIRQMDAHVKDLKAFRGQGIATDLDVQKAQVQLSSLHVRRIEAENQIRTMTMRLNSLTGRPLESSLRTTDGDGMDGDTISAQQYSKLLWEARSSRPELRALELRMKANQVGVSVARAGWYPTIALTANYDYANPNSRIIPPKKRWDDTWDVGINLQWNVWDWSATSYQTAQATAALRQTEATLSQMWDAIALDVAQSQQSVRSATEMLRVSEEGVAAAAEAGRTTDERFRQGLASSSDVLDAQSAAIQADVTRIQAKADLAIAVARLERALGRSMR